MIVGYIVQFATSVLLMTERRCIQGEGDFASHSYCDIMK
jgi:hypothetical protein